jgi:trehalose/maltose hydrolase-like predicted phosphorylase
MNQAHIAALETRIVAEDWSGTIEIRSTIDGNVRNSGVKRYRELASTHLGSFNMRALSENSVLLTAETTQSRIPVALAARTTMWRNDTPLPATYRLVDEEFEIGHEIFADLATGESLSVEKVVALVTGRDVATSEPVVAVERRLGRQGRFAEIRDAHVLRWSHLWERMSIEFEDHADELRILRLHLLHLLHLLQTVSHNSDDLDVGVPARGLHGEAYRGHIFWDELFIFPVLNLRFPTITRSLLRYRYRRLLEARRAARLAGYSGAMFPLAIWQRRARGKPRAAPESAIRPVESRPQSPRTPHRDRRRLQRVAVLPSHRRPGIPHRLWHRDAGGNRPILVQQGNIQPTAGSLLHQRRHRTGRVPFGLSGQTV